MLSYVDDPRAGFSHLQATGGVGLPTRPTADRLSNTSICLIAFALASFMAMILTKTNSMHSYPVIVG